MNNLQTKNFEYFSIFPTVFCIGCNATLITSTPSMEIEINTDVHNFQDGIDEYLASEGIAAFDCVRYILPYILFMFEDFCPEYF